MSTKTHDFLKEITTLLIDQLGEKKRDSIERFTSYCLRLKLEKNRDQSLKNPWMQKKTAENLASLYRRVSADGLDFDGVNITLQSTGVSFNYIAYKNKMLLVYPESKIDISLVYKEDKFSFSKNSGIVTYSHEFSNPFDQEDDSVIGGYCIVKNQRGEFLTILSAKELQKHRSVAKTDFIWRAWFKEMCMKTLIKKCAKYHFQDVFEKIDELDNENYDLSKFPKSTQGREISLEEIKMLYESVEEQISPEEQIQIERIINQQEVKSYKKLFNHLNALAA